MSPTQLNLGSRSEMVKNMNWYYLQLMIKTKCFSECCSVTEHSRTLESLDSVIFEKSQESHTRYLGILRNLRKVILGILRF